LTREQYKRHFDAIGAKAKMLAGHEINRRASNGGRYWAMGMVIAEWQASAAIAEIKARMLVEIDALDEQWEAELQ
jgi:hypothetical protein